MNTAHASILGGALAALALAAPLSLPQPAAQAPQAEAGQRIVLPVPVPGPDAGSQATGSPSPLDDEAAPGLGLPTIPGSAPRNASGSSSASAGVPAGRHVWPTGGPARVLRSFDPPAQRWLAGHRGVDLELEPNAPVHASAAGTVVYAGRLADRFVVSIEHPNGLRTTYEPVAPTVSRGQSVTRGQVIGHLEAESPEGPDSPAGGASDAAGAAEPPSPRYAHCGAASCLHWGARRAKDDYMDPLALLSSPAIRLLG